MCGGRQLHQSQHRHRSITNRFVGDTLANKRLSLETTDSNSACAILRKPAVQPPERPTPAVLQYLGQS